MSVLKTFLMFLYASELPTHLYAECLFPGPVIIQCTCEMTLELEGVHLYHIPKHWLHRLSLFTISQKNERKILVKNSKCTSSYESALIKQTTGSFYKETPYTLSAQRT